MTDKIIRVLDNDEALLVHNFNVILGKENKGFYRYFEDHDDFKDRDGLTYHYVQYEDNNYRIEYKDNEGKLKFTGNVVEIDESATGPEFDEDF